MSGVDQDAEAIGFETSPTGRFGIAAVSERERDTIPMRAVGTPSGIEVPADDPITDPIAGPATAEIPTPTLPDALAALPPSLYDAPTIDRTPFPRCAIGLIEEAEPLDRDATERALLAAIASGDESSRLVYADWLEERDEHARAGFLRIEQLVSRLSPDDPRREACMRQLRELVQHIDLDWRARVARPRIEGCPQLASRCPQRWDALARTDREAVRRCGACAKEVCYFASVDDARGAARQGHRVAIDVSSERWEDDLADVGTRCWSCARRIVSSARFCPHCGEPVHRLVPIRAGGDDGDDDDDGDDGDGDD